MIASWRGLAVIAAIAVALIVAALLDIARVRTPVDRALVPGFDADRVTELIWERTGQPALRVARDGEIWRLRAPARSTVPRRDEAPDPPADPRAISDVLAALRGARWHRRGAARPGHTTLTVVAGARHALAIGEPVAGTEQSWITTGDSGLLVDRWVAHALDRDLLALRIKAPLAEVAGAPAIEIASEADRAASLRLEGRPRRVLTPEPLVLAEDISDGLERALREITIVRVPDSPVTGHGIAVTAGDAARGPLTQLSIGGSCPGAPELVAISGTTGDGCIAGAAAAALERAIAVLRQPPAAIVERRPVASGLEVARIVLADGAALEVEPPRLAGAAADPARVAELLLALHTPAETAALPARPPAHRLVISDRSGAAITLDVFAERVIARHGEPVALRPPAGVWNLLVRPSRELREIATWLEEPTTISALRIDGVRYVRGQVIGEWTRQPPGRGAVDGKLVEALARALAAPRALGPVEGSMAIAHRVAIEVTAPVGAASEHALEIGAPRAAGCPARIGQDAILLPLGVCTMVARLAS